LLDEWPRVDRGMDKRRPLFFIRAVPQGGKQLGVTGLRIHRAAQRSFTG
jgi:hypothetical protein